MPSAPKAPAAPDPNTVMSAQTGANITTGTAQQNLNMVGQSNPFGTLGYTQVGTNPDGTPKYEQTSQYTPEMQSLLNSLIGSKGSVGGAGENLAAQAYNMYSEVPDFGTAAGSRVSQGIDRQLPYMERMMAPAREQLDTQLRNQGILPGTPAYHQQMDKLNDQQALEKGNWMNSFQGQAFNQAIQEYQVPEQMIERLMSAGAPMALKESFGQTPTVSMTAPNAQAAYNSQYEAQKYAYQQQVARQNMLMNMGLTVGSAALGMPVSPGMMGGMFGSSGSTIGSTPGQTIGPGGMLMS